MLIITISVLMAFYMTEYGKRVSRNQSAKNITEQIYFELKNNLRDLEGDFLLHEIGLASNLRVMKFLDNKEEISDSLIMDFYWMTRDEYIFANSSGYENLKSFGVNLIQDDSLRQLITIVYNNNFPRLTKGNTIYPDINEYLMPFFRENFKMNRDTTLKYKIELENVFSIEYPREIGLGVKHIIGYVPINREALLENEEFRVLVNKSLEFRMYKYGMYRQCIQNVKKTIERIEELKIE